jgi:hypothetical protein
MYNCYNYLEPCALNVDPPPPPSKREKQNPSPLTPIKKKKIGPYLK